MVLASFIGHQSHSRRCLWFGPQWFVFDSFQISRGRWDSYGPYKCMNGGHIVSYVPDKKVKSMHGIIWNECENKPANSMSLCNIMSLYIPKKPYGAEEGGREAAL